ncbi:MAG: hypothetical protein DRH08_00965 [Deltaproteobacteria bacterium]|nr:MAG: hypothetical protein DRH08_00965 [Deltaproteobacteria bacterium]
MNGLKLAEEYFISHGLPLICDHFPDYKDRIAAGLVGLGSDCLGFDDKFSRDHDWGPGFCLWLTKTDYNQIGSSLMEAYNKLPNTFSGFEREPSEWGNDRVGVFETGAFYQRLLGQPNALETLYDWLPLHGDNLSVCTSGKVFYDPLGEFSKIRAKLLAFYPDDVRLVKIAARCMVVGQSGQYNFLRSLWRKDYFAVQYAETKFCADVMSLVYLLNHSYAPYYKWLMRGVKTLPILGEFVFEKVSAMMILNDYKQKKMIIDEICAAVILELQKEGLSDSNSRFFVDHGPVIHEKIVDPTLRNMNVWAG